jgi:hypothetical protein
VLAYAMFDTTTALARRVADVFAEQN